MGPRPYYPMSGHWALTQLADGQPFFVDTRSRDITPWIAMTGTWEGWVDAVLTALARPGDTFVDGGANMGFYTVRIGGLVGPAGRVFAFEPNPEMFAFVRENIAINGRSGRDAAWNVALGQGSGTLVFAHDREHPGGGVLMTPGESARADLETQTVAVAALDDLLPQDAVAHLIKIDVEGFEAPLLLGAERLLARSPDAAIVCELAFDQWARFGSPAALLRRFAGSRRIFEIRECAPLEEITDRLEALPQGYLAYMLLLPDTAERAAQIAHLLPGYAPSEPPAEPEPPPAEPEPEPEPEPPPSRLRRGADKLLRALNL